MHTVCCSGQFGGGWLPRGVSAQEGVCPGGCVWPGVSSRGGGVWPGGVWPGSLSRGYLSGGCRPREVSAHGGLPGGCLPRGCVSGQGVSATTPCEQNHRRLWKYNLAVTTLRTVTNFSQRCWDSFQPGTLAETVLTRRSLNWRNCWNGFHQNHFWKNTKDLFQAENLRY